MKRKLSITLYVAWMSLFLSVAFAFNLYFYSKNKEKIEDQENTQKILKSNELLNRGINAANSGDLTSAIDLYQNAISIYSNNADAYQFLGYAEYVKYYNHGKKENFLLMQAQKDMEKALSLNSGNIWAHYNDSIILWASNKPEEAIQQIKEVLMIDPSFKKNIQKDNQFKKFKTSKEFMQLVWDK